MPKNIIEGGIQRCSKSIIEIVNNVINKIQPKIKTIELGSNSKELGLESIETRNNKDDKTSTKKYLEGIGSEQNLHLPRNNNQLNIGIFCCHFI